MYLVTWLVKFGGDAAQSIRVAWSLNHNSINFFKYRLHMELYVLII